MEFAFSPAKAFGSRELITVWNSKTLLEKRQTHLYNQLAQIIDKMGEASAKAQGLPRVITTASKIIASDHVLYIHSDGTKVNGILKVGKKNLFIRNEIGAYKEIEPLCVLDFYAHESCQRNGIGKTLFEFMLQRENVVPRKLGYDRPSPKLLAFLAKHYGLKNYIPQSNNFVVYKQYFESNETAENKEPPMASISMRPLTARNKRAESSVLSTVSTNSDWKSSTSPLSGGSSLRSSPIPPTTVDCSNNTVGYSTNSRASSRAGNIFGGLCTEEMRPLSNTVLMDDSTPGTGCSDQYHHQQTTPPPPPQQQQKQHSQPYHHRSCLPDTPLHTDKLSATNTITPSGAEDTSVIGRDQSVNLSDQEVRTIQQHYQQHADAGCHVSNPLSSASALNKRWQTSRPRPF